MSRRRGRDLKRGGAPAVRRAGWNWTLPIFLAGVFVVKAIVLAQLQHHPLLEPDGGVDSTEYVALARRVLAGDLLLRPGLYYLSPLYVYFLAALLGSSDSFTFVRLVQIALGTAAVWCIYVSARVWFGARAAWIAAVLAALTGVFTFYEIVVFQSSIDVFLTAAALACLARGLAGSPSAGVLPGGVPPGRVPPEEVPPEGGSYKEGPVVSSSRRNAFKDVPVVSASRRNAFKDVPVVSASRRNAFKDVPVVSASRRNALKDVPVVSAFRRNALKEVPVVSAFRRNALFAGLIFGLQFLNRPNIAIAIASVVLTLLATRRWRTAAWLAAGLAIAVAPLVVRNAIVTHRFALTSSQGGLNFYIGNHDGANGQYVAVPGVRANMAGQAEDTRKVAEAALGHSLSDAEVSAYFTELAASWIRQHPAAAGKLFVRKLALTLNARHQWLDYSYPYYAHDTDSWLGWLFVGPWILVPLGVLGAALMLTGSPGSPGSSGSSGSPGSGFAGFAGPGFDGFAGSVFAGFTGSAFVWFVFVPSYAISVALFFVAERYRLPLFVPLCVLSGTAVDRALQAFRSRTSDLAPRTSGLGPRTSVVAAASAAALLIAGAIVTAWPFHLDDGRYEERLRLSKILMNHREYDAAAEELRLALALRPGDPTTEFHLGMAQMSAGRTQEGLAHVRHAVDGGVPIKGARYALANAMLTTGDRDGAVALLRTYYPAPEDDAESCFHVAQLAMNAGAPLVAERYLQRAVELRPGWSEPLQLLQQLRR